VQTVRGLRILFCSVVVCIAGLAASGVVERRMVLGVWEPRRALVTTLPFAILWALVGGGLVLRGTRSALRGRGPQAWLIAGSAAGVAIAGLSLALVGPPSEYTIGFVFSGALCGLVLGTYGRFEALQVTRGSAEQPHPPRR